MNCLENIPTKKERPNHCIEYGKYPYSFICLRRRLRNSVTTPGSRPPVIPGTFQILVLETGIKIRIKNEMVENMDAILGKR